MDNHLLATYDEKSTISATDAETTSLRLRVNQASIAFKDVLFARGSRCGKDYTTTPTFTYFYKACSLTSNGMQKSSTWNNTNTILIDSLVISMKKIARFTVLNSTLTVAATSEKIKTTDVFGATLHQRYPHAFTSNAPDEYK